MFALDLVRVVFVAGRTIIERVAGGDVTGGAIKQALFAMVEWEIMLTETSRQPGVDGMTVITGLAENPQMDLRFLMASNTFPWRTVKQFIYMAGLTCLHQVLTFHRPDIVMVKISHFTAAMVTALTIKTKLFNMIIHENRFRWFVAVDTTAVRQRYRLGW